MNRHHQLNTTFSDIGRRSINGGLSLLSSNALQLVIMVGTTMVLARVLTPRDFGIVAMGTILIGLVGPIRDFGLPFAIVHQPHLDHDHVSELFWLNLKLTTLLSVIMAAMAPLMAWFFDQPQLIWIILVLTCGVLARGTANLQTGLLQRQMRFGVISAVNAGSLIAGAAAGIAYALWIGGYWALVVQQLVILLTQTGLSWLVCPWRPERVRATPESRGGSVHAMITYSKNTSLARIVSEVGAQMDRVLLGRFVGAEQLGLYQNAQRWAAVPALQLLQPLRTVAVSGFSRLRDDRERYRAYARKAFTIVLALTLPMFVFLCIEAQEVVLLLLGPQWVDAGILFQILALAMLFTSPDRVSKWIYLSEGQTLRGLRWQLISTPCLIIAMVAGLPWGAVGVATGFCAAKALLAYPSLWFCLRTSPLRSADFWGAALRPALATFGAAAILLLSRFTQIPPVEFLALRLLTDAVLFALLYAGIWLASPGGLRTMIGLLETLKPARDTSREPGTL